MPTPHVSESKGQFITRCMGDAESIASFQDASQRYAFCISQWNSSNVDAEVLDLFDDVARDGGINVALVKDFLSSNKGNPVTFRISTLGGDLDQALTIYALIRKHTGSTHCDIVGATASAGTIIALACDTRAIAPHALFLIHNCLTGATGNATQLRRTAEMLDKNDAIMVNIYKERTGLDEETIRDLMAKEDWLTPDDAINMGFIHAYADYELQIAANYQLINSVLKQKLEQKMSLFGNKKKPAYLQAFKNGTQVLASAEVLAEGVELSPLGAASLEDGTFELADGRTITVAGGVITEVVEPVAVAADPEPDPEPKEMDVEAIVAGVTQVVSAMIGELEAKFDAKIEGLTKMASKNTPPKTTALPVAPKVTAKKGASEAVENIVAGIRTGIVAERSKYLQ
jgi:ATP-dependent Clp protease, protease subunit